MRAPAAVEPAVADPSATDALDGAARVIARPRQEPADSFVLHAPLETLARVGLLTHVGTGDRGPILEQIGATAAAYDAYEPWSPGPVTDRTIADESTARRTFTDGLARGDADAVDDAVHWLTGHLDTDELVRAVVDPIVPSLAAAAHGAIFLYLLPRTAARHLRAATMLRTTAHELARHPEWRLSWYEHPDERAPVPADEAAAELVRRLSSPTVAAPESNFIQPTMAAVEGSGLAAELLGDLVGSLTVRTARPGLLRTAARSMLQDDPAHAPYGWSHCLTMPQAALGVATASTDPSAAIAVAATYVFGFRATLGSSAIDLAWQPDPAALRVDGTVELDRPPLEAAGAAWHATPDQRPAIWRSLAAHAGGHDDAHLAKYTLACLDAARGDPSHEHLYLAAAASLNSWWRQPHPA